MFKKHCPNCSNKITIAEIKEFAILGEFQCPYCRKTLEVAKPIVFFNAILVGGAIGIFLGAFTELSIAIIITITIFISLFFQWILDLFFTLSVKDDPY
jgi:NAD-dependent SIR2 family protein deacetylase